MYFRGKNLNLKSILGKCKTSNINIDLHPKYMRKFELIKNICKYFKNILYIDMFINISIKYAF